MTQAQLIDVIFRFQEDIFGAVSPILQKIGRIVLVGVLLNQNWNHTLVTLKSSIKRYEYYAGTLCVFPLITNVPEFQCSDLIVELDRLFE